MNQKGFIKDLVIVILGVLVLGGGYFVFFKKTANAPAETSSQTETANWKTYRSDEFGFELKYPTNSEVVDQSFFRNESDFQVDINYSSGGYEPPRMIISSVADNRPQIVPLENDLFIKNNNKNGENPIYFYKENRRIYANCVDYGGVDILDFCNKVLSTFKFTK